jgi:hypothetical protein
MAKRQGPDQKEYSPLDDGRGRFPVETELVRDVIGPLSPRIPHVPEQRSPAPSTTSAEMSAQSRAAALVREEREGSTEEAVGAETPSRPIVLERLTKGNKFLTTPREKLELDRLAAMVSGALGVSVRPSHLIRACLIHLLHAEPQILRRAQRHTPLRRPSNTEAVAIAEFDQMIAEILQHAFRDAGPIVSTRRDAGDDLT